MAAFTTIDDAGSFFNTKLWTGNSPSSNAITSLGFQPDFVWIKCRDAGSRSFVLTDAVRGTDSQISTDDTTAETTNATMLTSFDSDGFTLGADSATGEVNEGSDTFVGWSWKAGTTTGIATDGSTTITPGAYSFNQTAGISIIEYTGTGAVATVAHGLGVAPETIWIKETSSVRSWSVFWIGMDGAAGVPEDYNIRYNTTAAKDDSDGYWNDTLPGSVNFDLGSAADGNVSGGTFIAYCFTPIQGFSKFGWWTGNGNADGNFIYTGFKPALVIMRKSSGTADWYMYDNKRLGYNIDNNPLFPNSNQTAGTANDINFLSNGFKMISTNGEINSGDLIYAAFAENPFVNSSGVPGNAR